MLYEIPAETAMFMFSGMVDGDPVFETAFNEHAIEVEMKLPMFLMTPVNNWEVAPFDFTYTDDNEDAWTLAIGTLFFTP